MRYVESLNIALHQLMRDDRVFVIGEDIIDPYGGAFKVTKGLSSVFPDRVITTPISEAGITGFAIGMALRGLRPIIEIMFGDFITLCADQIINSATKFSWIYNQQMDVPIVIRTPMGGRRGYGPTHSQTLEAIFLNVPGLTIIAPSHFHEPGNLLSKAVLSENKPVLFIENKSLYPQQLLLPDEAGKIGDFFVKNIFKTSQSYPSISFSMTKEESPQVTLIAYGGMAPFAIEAAFNLFMRDEVIVEVLVPSLIKPFPLQDVLLSVLKSKRVVIAEESPRTSGWGAELASQIYENAFQALNLPIVRIGAKDCPIPSSKDLEKETLPQTEDIKKSIYKLLN